MAKTDTKRIHFSLLIGRITLFYLFTQTRIYSQKINVDKYIQTDVRMFTHVYIYVYTYIVEMYQRKDRAQESLDAIDSIIYKTSIK